MGDSRFPILIRNRAGTIAGSIASGPVPDKVASYHPTQPANHFQEKFLNSGDFSKVGLLGSCDRRA
jgi:hypothetical protein